MFECKEISYIIERASGWCLHKFKNSKVMELNCVQPVKAIESSISSCAPVAYIIGFLYATPTKQGSTLKKTTLSRSL